MINKSLTCLGNVINVLADKAMGKGKNLAVPYRDSALTRMLQTALGGNSKTIMICALSPANTNYEETLSTLNYAKRAKKIQNKAVVNENPLDRQIRELKEENDRLKKQLASQGGG
jgi:kinesin family protein 1